MKDELVGSFVDACVRARRSIDRAHTSATGYELPLRSVVSEVWSERNGGMIELLSCGHMLRRARPGVSGRSRRCWRCAGFIPPEGEEPT